MPIRTKKTLTHKGIHMMMEAAIDKATRLDIDVIEPIATAIN